MSFLQRCKAPIQRLSRLGVADMFGTHGKDFFSSAQRVASYKLKYQHVIPQQLPCKPASPLQCIPGLAHSSIQPSNLSFYFIPLHSYISTHNHLTPPPSPSNQTLLIPYPVLGPRLLYTHTLNTTCNSNLSTHARTHQSNRSRTRLLNQIPSPPHFYIITPSSYLTSLFHLEKAPTPLHRPLHTHIKHVNCIC